MNQKATPKLRASTDKAQVVIGHQAMDFILHGTQSTVTILTPLGKKLTFNSLFIGFDARLAHFNPSFQKG